MKSFSLLREGRPSQQHPLEGHDYHKKTDDELVYIAKDAHKAAEAMKDHNTTAENKYRDQANDSATVRYFRQKNGMPEWYKKKYGHVKQSVTEARAASRSTRAGLEKLGKLNAMTPEDRKAYNEKQADQVRKREATRDAKWRAEQSKKAAKAHANSGEQGVAAAQEKLAEGSEPGQVKKNKDGSYVATNQAGTRKIFKSERSAKSHANTLHDGYHVIIDRGTPAVVSPSGRMNKNFSGMYDAQQFAKKKNAEIDKKKNVTEAHANSGEPGVSEGFPHDVDHMPGKTIKYQDTNCTTCHGRKSMYKLGNKLFADNKQGAEKVKCPTCKGTGDKPGLTEGIKDEPHEIVHKNTGKTVSTHKNFEDAYSAYQDLSKASDHAIGHIPKKTNEDVEPITELSSETLDSYKEKAKKSSDSLTGQGKYRQANDRTMNVMKATGKQIDKTVSNIRKSLNSESTISESRRLNIVREAMADAKKKDQKKKSEKKVESNGKDKYQSEPELSTQIIKNNV